MKMTVWVLGLSVVLLGSSAYAKDGSKKESDKKPKCACPAPKYDGQGEKHKCNNGHGNNEDGVDTSNPGNSKKGQDSDSDVDDEKKTGGGKK